MVKLRRLTVYYLTLYCRMELCVCDVYPAGCGITEIQRRVTPYKSDWLCFLSVFCRCLFFLLRLDLLLRRSTFLSSIPHFYLLFCCTDKEKKSRTHRIKLWEQIVCPCKSLLVIYTSTQSCVQRVAGAYLHVGVCEFHFQKYNILSFATKEKNARHSWTPF